MRSSSLIYNDIKHLPFFDLMIILECNCMNKFKNTITFMVKVRNKKNSYHLLKCFFHKVCPSWGVDNISFLVYSFFGANIISLVELNSIILPAYIIPILSTNSEIKARS